MEMILRVTPSAYPPLREPIELTVSYTTDGILVAEDSTIGIRAAGDTIAELKQDVLTLLDFMVDSYIVRPCTEMDPKLAQAVATLKKVIDPRKRVGEHWVDVD